MIDTEAFSCQELVELVTDYLEGALSPGDLRRFEEHIAVCDACTEYLRQLRETIRARRCDHARRSVARGRGELLEVFAGWRAG